MVSDFIVMVTIREGIQDTIQARVLGCQAVRPFGQLLPLIPPVGSLRTLTMRGEGYRPFLLLT
jgi:hypothetical protein